MATTGTGRKRWSCNQCSASYSQAGKLSAHRKRVHEGYVPDHECDLCGVKFSSKCNKLRHLMVVHHALKKFNCMLCDQRFATKSSLTAHMLRAHSQGKKLSCDKCEKSFYYLRNLKEHVARCGVKPQHKCEECETMFSTVRAMKLHVSSKHEKKSFICELVPMVCVFVETQAS